MINRIIKTILILTLFGFLAIFGIFAYAYYNTVDDELDKVIKYTPDISTEILDRNGNRIAFIFKKRHRLYATYNEIPVSIVEGLIAMEDTRFFEHNGINPDAILRAIIKDIKARRFVEGGSTITQQLIKNILFSNKKKITRKIKEVILAIKLEQKLTKEEILERYLNEIPYGNNYLGVKTAAWGYFRKDLSNLTLKESAILVGLPNAPSYYNPLRHYDRAIKRANLILRRLRKLGWITEKEYQIAIKEKPKVYRTSLTQNIAPYIVDEVVRRLKHKLNDLKTGGYKILTTIDLKKQKLAREALRFGFFNTLKQINEEPNKSDLNGAIVVVENKTGDILALVGGVDYKKSKFNRATMINRQPGSAFKPFVYQTALDLGYNPATKIPDLARTFRYKKDGVEYTWSPQNYERDFKGFITLREALVHSRNLATVNLVADIGIKQIIERLKKLDVKNIPRNLSISLGNLAISPIKMAQIYTVFSNYGHMIEPRLVSKVVSKYNSVIYETKPKEIANFTKPEQAYLMTTILKDVIKRGTGKQAKVKGIELAGKTGTTDGYKDAWFCGYSPTITTIIWFGRDRYKSIGDKMSGGKVSAPVFSYFYRNLLKIEPNLKRKFYTPKGVKVGFINGRKEYYTAISPLPKESNEFDLYSNFPPSQKREKSKEKKSKPTKVQNREDNEEDKLKKEEESKKSNENKKNNKDDGSDIVEIYDFEDTDSLETIF
jgi:penicillin-binding protein 1A